MLYSMADGSAASISGIAAATAAACSVGTYLAHTCTPLLWPRYARLTRKRKIAWCNRIVSAAHVRRLLFPSAQQQTREPHLPVRAAVCWGRLPSSSAARSHPCVTPSCWQTPCMQYQVRALLRTFAPEPVIPLSRGVLHVLCGRVRPALIWLLPCRAALLLGVRAGGLLCL